MDLYENLVKELQNLEGKTQILTDWDLDGICSGLLTKIILRKLNKEFIINLRPRRSLDIKDLRKFLAKREDISNLILLDSPYSNESLIVLAKEFQKLNIIYIDHHKTSKPENIPDNLKFFDARVAGIYPISTTEVIYNIGKTLFGNKFSKYSLIGVIGAFGDWMLKGESELFKDFVENYEFLYKEVEFTIPMVEVLALFLYCDETFLIQKGDLIVENPLEFFKNINSSVIRKAKRKFEEKWKILSKLKPIYVDEKMFVARSKFASSISTFLSGFLRKDIIAILDEEKLFKIFSKGVYKVSLRKGKKNNLNLGKIIENFPKKIHGGGHPEAAGGKIYEKDLEEFMKYLKMRT